MTTFRETALGIATVVMLLISAAALPAAASSGDREVRRQAVEIALEGKRLLEEGRVEAALAQFELALGLDVHPKTLFFKATCLNLLDRDLVEARRILHEIKGDPDLGPYAAELPGLLVQIELKLRPVPLVVTVEGGGEAEVFVDGESVGAAPYRGDVTRGEHVVRVGGADCVDPEQRFRADANDPPVLSFRCAAPPLPADVDLSGTPDGVAVAVDGAVVGHTPLSEPLQLPAGEHTLALSKEGYVFDERTLRVEPGQRVVLDVMTPSAPADLSLRAASDDRIHPAWFWSTLGSGAALALTGTGFLIKHGVDVSRARGETATHEADWIDDRNVIIGSVTLGVGVALGVTSIFLWPGEDEEPGGGDGPVVGGGTGEAVVGWRGRF